MAGMNNIFSRSVNAAQSALGKMGKLTGQSQDPNVRLYETLKPTDFDAIIQKFGADDTMEYIQRMESRRLLGGQNANKSTG